MYVYSGNDNKSGYKNGECVIAMPSQTYAIQGETLILGAGIPARVVRLPAGATKKGCAFGVAVSLRYLTQAVNILEKKGVRHGELLS